MVTGQVVQVVQVIQVIKVVQVVEVVRMFRLDDMHSENIWFSGSNSSNYRGKLRCHACDRRTEDGKWKIEQCSVRPETTICVVLGLLLLLL